MAPSNFYLTPGTHSAEEIIRSVKQGFYVTELIGFGEYGDRRLFSAPPASGLKTAS